ncbi:YdcF family protein [Kamptonema formosum]|uniref:YdcF family protein n=1 Tax=Kamptonema formosum TaxID=331992 RepID=UPI000347CB60|nr:YdcF family protein [Oscillatoria sp. PCC 10802]
MHRQQTRSSGRSFFVLLLGLSVICWFGYRQIKSQIDQPEAMLVLGGDTKREVFAAKLAREYPDIEIWVSGGSNREYAEWVFSEAGIDRKRLHLDERAVDTVTNFTTLVDELQARKISSIYLVTSDDHMRRATVIGEIILGSRGMTFKPVPVPSGRDPEPIKKSIRDGARAILWVATGHTGSSLSRHFERR